MTSDPHEWLHRIVQVDPIPGTGCAIRREQADHAGYRHVRLVLAAGETDGEHLGCWEGDADEDWGIPVEDLACITAHVGTHLASGTPPSDHCELWDWD